MKYNKGGFTLVEMSIVLIIVGLILGGILVGRDMILSAQIRATVSQVEKYNVAANTFKLKYNGLPGDLADGLGFGFARNGNGDGCIGSCNSAGSISSSVVGNFNSSTHHEIPLFWNELSQAGLISGNYDGDTSVVTYDTVGRTFPKIAIIPKFGFAAYAGRPYFNGPDSIRNYYMMVIGFPATFSVPALSGTAVWQPGVSQLKPIEAQHIDQKMDDGFPGAGIVQAHDSDFLTGYYPDAVVRDGDSTHAPLLPPAAGWYCSYIPAASTQWLYNVTDATSSCALRIKPTF